MSAQDRIWTIGHSNQPLHEFLQILLDADISCVVDVRSTPYSAYSPQFNGKPLAAALLEKGIRYEFFGDSLGGRPPELSMFDQEGHVLYGEVARSSRFIQGLEALRSLAQVQPTAMMCSEENPVNCHRRLLIARVLRDSIEVIHLRSDGSCISEGELSSELEAPALPQLFSFEEEKPWRSIRPVLRNTGHENSLDS
jgi:uncharacterized protein (DUF488 family)